MDIPIVNQNINQEITIYPNEKTANTSSKDRIKLIDNLVDTAINTTIDHAIKVLNEILMLDKKAIESLISNRVECNEALADHPTVQVGAIMNKTSSCGKSEYMGSEITGYNVGLLGIINGLFGVDENKCGYIAARYNDDGNLICFERFKVGEKP